MNRRDFLKLSAVATAWPWTHPLFSEQNIKGLALDRLAKWAPSSAGVEWRYVAGRITDNNQDSGFIVSISDIKVSGAESQQCLVERQDFMGNKTFTGNRYSGILSYNDITATYTFKLNTNQELVSWQWDNAAGVYKLNVTAPELTLTNLILTPAGDLIPEGGDGEIRVGRLGDIPVISNYHADWTKITINSVEKGIARVDMQGLRRLNPMAMAETVPDYDHNWFVIAAQLNNGDSVWVSAWKIASSNRFCG